MVILYQMTKVTKCKGICLNEIFEFFKRNVTSSESICLKEVIQILLDLLFIACA